MSKPKAKPPKQGPDMAGMRERLFVEGYTYERARRCKDPSPTGNWLDGWKVA